MCPQKYHCGRSEPTSVVNQRPENNYGNDKRKHTVIYSVMAVLLVFALASTECTLFSLESKRGSTFNSAANCNSRMYLDPLNSPKLTAGLANIARLDNFRKKPKRILGLFTPACAQNDK
ncbi:hypothetical protein BDV26DRAFT_113133 [Aspergillus bertholletiae]|uniref:Uncharacterized protein n=1 Tax=Aspergillus bertholletiae TaxID=1226010 RepID=A0A5N7AQ00_9EURO|nr:hypothetical protein BDV26DRAFT_113133 [Aspergillus bertholletiae]